MDSAHPPQSEQNIMAKCGKQTNVYSRKKQPILIRQILKCILTCQLLNLLANSVAQTSREPRESVKHRWHFSHSILKN